MAGPQRILLVEDNPVTRLFARATLVSGGYQVIEAADGRTALDLFQREPPDLVLQDLLLPDMDGTELVGRFRAQRADIPILAFSALLSPEERRSTAGAFDDLLPKRIEPGQLLQAVRAHLPPPRAPGPALGLGRRVLVVDDDPLQRKLLRIRLSEIGFDAVAAEDGAEALERLRAERFEAIVSDCLMPRLDGFHLCQAIRQDPNHAGVPVILATSTYVEGDDARLARGVGADALVLRSPDYAEVIAALTEALREGRVRPVSAPPDQLASTYTERISRQLERQAALNLGLSQRLSLQAAEMAILSGIAEDLARRPGSAELLASILDRCLDAGGISTGALYLRGREGGLALEASTGYDEAGRALLPSFFGHLDLLERLVEGGRPVGVPSADFPGEVARKALELSRAGSAVIVPISAKGERLGAMVMSSQRRDLQSEEWTHFARAVATQIGQALALARAIAETAASEARYRGLFEASPDAMMLADAAGRTLSANPAAQELAGRPAEELDGRKLSELFPSIFPEGGPQEGGSGEARPVVRPSGEERQVETSVSRIAPDLWLVILRDVTSQRRLQAQVAQSEKLAAMGELLAGVAHELNNPLAVVLGQASLLRRATGDGPLADRATKIATAAERCARIVKNFLGLARQQPPDRQRVLVDQVVGEVLELLAYPLRVDSIEVDLSVEPDLPPLWADAHQLQQVLVNLVTNAQHAMRGQAAPKRLTVRAARGAGEATVVLEVEDTGPGIPPHLLDRIFEPFFTTKPVGQGTGLGLSLCRGMVASHGGSLAVENAPGRGALFRVELPAEPAAAPAKTPRPAASALPAAVILVVDDEPSVLDLLADVLALEGHRVVAVSSAAEASRRLRAERFDAVLSDVRMPGVDGPSLYREIQRIRPEQAARFVFMTGDTLNAETRDFLAETAVPILSKPFGLEDVRNVLRRALVRE